MFTNKFAQDIVEFERRLDVEKEHLKDRHTATFLTTPAPHSSVKKHETILGRIFGNDKNRQPECATCPSN
jgi:hypothetical protein